MLKMILFALTKYLLCNTILIYSYSRPYEFFMDYAAGVEAVWSDGVSLFMQLQDFG